MAVNQHNQVEEALEKIWALADGGITRLADLRARHPARYTDEIIDELARRGLARLESERLDLTEMGRERARGIVRRHRLAERLLKDVLNMEERESEDEACEFEHSLTPGIVDSICTLLGHPRECPHGLPIPDGNCCRREFASVEAIVMPLSQMRIGEIGVVSYLSSRNYNRIKKLHAFGIHPGAEVAVLQRSPAVVMKVEESQIAVEAEVAADIYVRRKGVDEK